LNAFNLKTSAELRRLEGTQDFYQLNGPFCVLTRNPVHLGNSQPMYYILVTVPLVFDSQDEVPL